MLVKHLVLGTLVALRSASALPNPDQNDVVDMVDREAEVDDSVLPEERDFNADLIGRDPEPEVDLVDRDDGGGHDCGGDGQWDSTRKQCICKAPGMIWHPTSRECRCPDNRQWDGHRCKQPAPSPPPPPPHCGPDASWDGHQCVCMRQGQQWDKRTRTCHCPQGQQWDGHRCKRPAHPTPPPRCGRHAWWDGHRCVCLKPGQTFNPHDKSCRCPDKFHWDGHQCVPPWLPACGPDAIWDGHQCACKQHGWTFDPTGKRCWQPTQPGKKGGKGGKGGGGSGGKAGKSGL